MRVAATDVSHVLPDVAAACKVIAPYVWRTPLLHSAGLSRRTVGQVHLKLECWQRTGSFKIRGALHKLAALSDDEWGRGIVTASAGNHGLGVAYACQALGRPPATIFVPEGAPAAKVDHLKGFDCQVRRAGADYDAAHAIAEAYAREQGAVYVSAYDDPVVIAGQGTVGLEVMEDLPGADLLLVPVGGGGLIAGVAVAAKAINPQVRVIGVQPEASPAAYLSLRDGRPYEKYNAAPTIADGLAGGFGRLPFEIAGHLIDEIVLVSEEETRAAVFALLELAQLVVEGAGAVSVAALLAGKVNLMGQKVVAVLSGANIDASLLFEIMMDEQSET